MPDKQSFLTPEGLHKLQAELDVLRTIKRPIVADRIHQAKELGTTVDNAEYDDAKNEQAFVEGRILKLEQMLKNVSIIREETSPSGYVRIGSKVKVASGEGEEEEYVIVGSAEASPRNGKISNESPVGQALLGKRSGDEVQVLVPAGVLRYKIIGIK
ncbi:MAG: transcription elongation factor GreA [Dehalococcoidia bacterium]|nr:transcription elongation factor GreA [Dehalococcoidia bacterium]